MRPCSDSLRNELSSLDENHCRRHCGSQRGHPNDDWEGLCSHRDGAARAKSRSSLSDARKSKCATLSRSRAVSHGQLWLLYALAGSMVWAEWRRRSKRPGLVKTDRPAESDPSVNAAQASVFPALGKWLAFNNKAASILVVTGAASRDDAVGPGV